MTRPGRLAEDGGQQRSVQHAREAAEICSQILRKDISFRDIRDRRKEIDAVIKEISGGG